MFVSYDVEAGNWTQVLGISISALKHFAISPTPVGFHLEIIQSVNLSQKAILFLNLHNNFIVIAIRQTLICLAFPKICVNKYLMHSLGYMLRNGVFISYGNPDSVLTYYKLPVCF